MDLNRYPAEDTFDEDSDNSSDENEDYDEGQDSSSDVVTDKDDDTTVEEAEARASTDMGTTASEEGEEHNQTTIPSCETKLEDSTVLRFLDVVQDHDSHCTPVERLRNFFDGVTLEQLGKDSEVTEGRMGCQTVLDDRNFTYSMYCRYERPLDPVKVYEKLMEKVKVALPHVLSRSRLTE